jgi:hypothetical protein
MATASQQEPEPSGSAGSSQETGWRAVVKGLGNWLVFLAALAVLAVGVLLLWDVWQGRPVAAAFTRVGGVTRVETAVEASRFWLTPPQHVVTTPADAGQQIMLGAARCATVYDAPLLFTSRNRKRQRLVDATIATWRKTARGSAHREVILNQRDVTRCLANANPSEVGGLPMLGLPDQPLWLSRIAGLAPLVFPTGARPTPLVASPARARRAPLVVFPDGERLAPVVIFAAAKAPGDPPDIAVGLALAAHMATTDRPVSLIVVPRYLEANPQLEDQLRKQRQVVEGGIVLGSSRILPDDTRALLRQLLTATDRRGLLGEIRTNLGSVGPLIAALLVLLGLGGAGREAPKIASQVVGLGGRVVNGTRRAWGGATRKEPEIAGQVAGLGQEVAKGTKELWRNIMNIRNGEREPAGPAKAEWLAALNPEERKGKVTVWLRNGWKITGIMNDQQSSNERPVHVRTMRVLRLDEAKLTTMGDEGGQHEESAKPVLVPFEDIRLIQVYPPASTPD